MESNDFGSPKFVEPSFQFESATSDERLDCMNFLERAFLYSMALTIVLGFVSIAHIALIKMNLIAEIKSWFGPAKVRKEFRNELCW